MTNIAYVFQPHFKTSVFRVATKDQQSDDVNFIVVTCSPHYNGVWKYDGELHKTCDKWLNKKTLCYCIPISDCTFVKSLDEVTNQSIRGKIIEQQKRWLDNGVANRDYSYAEIPNWVVSELKK